MQFESHIPIPTKARGKGIAAILREMDPGESHVFPSSEFKAVQVRSAMKSVCDHTDPSWSFTTKAIGTGLRVWRIS